MCQKKRSFCRIRFRGLAALAAALFLLSGGYAARAEESLPTPIPENIRTDFLIDFLVAGVKYRRQRR